MSIYANLVGTECNVCLWLGTTIHTNGEPVYFHIGDRDDPHNWANQELCAVRLPS